LSRSPLSAAFFLALSGCCSPPCPPAAKFFDRQDPVSTLKGFVYAVDTHQWDYAYESLAKGTRDEVGPTKFQVVIRFLEEPESGVALFDLISNALDLRSDPEYGVGRDEARILVISKGRDSSGKTVYFEAFIYLRREDDEWRLDLLRSLGVDSPDDPRPAELTGLSARSGA
jgi:hypothetical protein